MKTVVGGRRSGKTLEAITAAIDMGAAVIFACEDMKKLLIEECKEVYGEDAAKGLIVYTVSEVIAGKTRGRRHTGFVIDEGNLVLEYFIKYFAQPEGFVTQYLTVDRKIPGGIKKWRCEDIDD